MESLVKLILLTTILQFKDRENYAPRPGIAIEASSSELSMQNLKRTAWPKRVTAENEI